MILPILLSLAALLLAFWLAWKFFRPHWARDLCAGQVWESADKKARWEIINAGPDWVRIHLSFYTGEKREVTTSRDNFRALLHKHLAELCCD